MRLQQGFAASEMGFRGRFAQQQSWAAHVRFGSEADIEAPSPDVRFTPKSGHALSKGARAGAALEIFLRFKTLACPTFVKRSIVLLIFEIVPPFLGAVAISPKSGHRSARSPCPLCAISGH